MYFALSIFMLCSPRPGAIIWMNCTVSGIFIWTLKSRPIMSMVYFNMTSYFTPFNIFDFFIFDWDLWWLVHKEFFYCACSTHLCSCRELTTQASSKLLETNRRGKKIKTSGTPTGDMLLRGFSLLTAQSRLSTPPPQANQLPAWITKSKWEKVVVYP